MPSILQDWVEELPLRYQGVLVSAVRGCDVAVRSDPSKLLQRCLRAEFLCPASSNPRSFMETLSSAAVKERMRAFLRSFDHYPNHYVMHLMHAAEVVGYHHPAPLSALIWFKFYQELCLKLHVTPESKDALTRRLEAEEEAFFQNQECQL